jgi:streptogramin lyase/predicted Ser/Thr protein kinase
MSDARIGSEVAGYRIESVLGRGGMGTVYVAVQSSPTRKVALKLLRPELLADEAFRRRFEHESEAAASTEHPNIVPIYAAGESDGTLYIAMRYVEGTDLRDLISTGGPLAADRAIEIVSQVASALDAAHARGLVHRDVKPGNILLDAGGNAYLSDFGLIKRSEVDTNLTKTGQFMGSIEYCAPEQIRGDPVDGRADVYSLGCVLFEAMAGRPPFTRETEIATLYAHLEEEPPSLSPGPPGPLRELDRVIAKAMAKRPVDRYATAGEFARDARHAFGVTSGEREAMSPRRRRQTLVIAVLIAVAALVGGAALLLRGGDDTKLAAVDGTGTGRTSSSVVRIDPETGELAQSVGGFNLRLETFFVPGLAVGEGGVWVPITPNVVHIDPVTGSIRATIFVQQSISALPAVAFRTVWLSTGHVVERINPATDELLRPVTLIPAGEPTTPGRTWIATGEGAVWVASETTVFKIDPVQSRVVLEIEVNGATGLAVGAGAVWVIDNLSGELLRFDPVSGRATGSLHLPGALNALAVGADVVWVLDADAGTVYVVDATQLSLEDTVRVGSDERDMVFGGGAIWLADGSESWITRIDPLTRQPTVFPVGRPAERVAVDPASMQVWVLRLSADEGASP